jgi:ketosteroid isomerase-like protein
MIRNFIILAAGALCLSVQSSAPAAAREDAAAIVRRKFDAFNAHDAGKLQALYAVDAVLHSPDNPNLSGNQPIADTYRGIFAMIPDGKDVLTRLDAVGPRVYAQFLLIGHLAAAPNQALAVRILSIYTVQNGHIVLDETYYDRKM